MDENSTFRCKASNGRCDVCGWESGCGVSHAVVREFAPVTVREAREKGWMK